MKSNSPPPDHEDLKALLASSFHAEKADDAPPLPDDLRERIRDQYGKPKTAVTRPGSQQSESWLGKLSRLFAQPAFSGAAAALVLIAVAAFLLLPDRPDRGGTRGTPDPPETTTAATVLLYAVDDEVSDAISEQLDPKATKAITDLIGEPSAEGRTVIIDGKAGLLKGYRSPDAAPVTAPLPETANETVLAIAEMLETLEQSEDSP